MAIHDKYYTSSSVSRHLAAGEHSWAEAVYQSGKPVLDAELNLDQEIRQTLQNLLWKQTVPSGWMRGPGQLDARSDYSFSAGVNTFGLSKRLAIVAGMPVVVEYTGTTTPGANLITLDSAPVFGGAPPDVKRTDFVFLEVWKALISDSMKASGTLQVTGVVTPADTISLGGSTLTAVAGAPAVDQFQIGASAIITASNIAAAINNSPPNSFTNLTATVDPGNTDTVIVYAAASGTAGNSLIFSSASVGLTLSGAGFLSGGTDTANKPTQDTIYRHGNVDAPAGVNLSDDLADPALNTETSKRVQIQYRLRHTGQTEAVNFKTEGNGFENSSLEARGAQASPVAGYNFVPADGSTIIGNSDASAYGNEDDGLWIAGDGSSTSAADLGTVDGYVYAIPVCFVFRRNDAFNGGAGSGFDPLNNTNGGLPQTHALFVNPIIGSIPVDTSDRPDGKFHDLLDAEDILDLRRQVVPGGIDLQAELTRQMQSLLDGNFQTWAIDASDKQDLGGGSGDVSWRFLVCNEVGRSGAEGGASPVAGDTPRGVSIANFDHVRRRFGDQPVVERVVFDVLPSMDSVSYPGKHVIPANGSYTGWAEDDTIVLDMSALNASTVGGDWDPTGATYFGGSGGSVFGFAPPGTTITNVLGAWHDDGNFTTAVSQQVQIKQVIGLGTDTVQIVLDGNEDLVNGGLPAATHRMVGDSGTDDGSARRIFIDLEITYPLGAGTTDTPDMEVTPDATVYPEGPVLETTTAQRPDDWEQLLTPRFREGRREVALEYVANLPASGDGSGTPITDTLVSRSDSEIFMPRRLFGSGALLTGVTDQNDLGTRDVDNLLTEWGSSSNKLVTDTSGGPSTKQPLSGAQTLVQVTYFAQDPIPNYGALGYQLALYYRSNAPQTAGSVAGTPSIQDPVSIAPLAMSNGVWTGQTGPGSADIPFPYTAPLDQIAVNDNSAGTFPGDWYFASTALISVDDFSAETGLLNLHPMLPVDSTGEFTFSSATKDLEFRTHFRVADPTAYRPTVFAQPLSGVNRHKVWLPFLARATEDTNIWRKNEVLLVVISRFAELDEENTVRFLDTDNRSCAAIYRTKGLLLLAGE